MKKNLMKVSAFCISLMLAASFFSGCGKKEAAPAGDTSKQAESAAAPESQAATEEKKAEQVTISGMLPTSMWNAGMDAVVKTVAEKTGVTLDVQKLPEGDQSIQVIKTKLATNDVPELLLFLSGGQFYAFNPEQNFIDISNEAFTSEIYDTVKGPLSYNEKLYGVPFNGYGLNIGGVFYNKKIFADLKLEVPKTWNEMLDACEKIKAAGKTPVYFSLKDAWTSQFFLLEHIPYIKKANPGFVDNINTNKAKFAATPAYIEGLARAKEIKDKGYINKDYLAATYDNAQKAIATGEAAMYPNGSWIMDQFAANYPENINDIGAFAMPSNDGDNSVTIWAPGGIFVMKSAKNVEAAKKWLAGYVTPEAQAEYYKIQKGFPAFKGVETDKYPAMAELAKYLDEGKSTLALEFETKTAITNLEKITSNVIVDGMTPEEGAKTCDDNFSKAMKAANQPGF